MVGQDDYRVTTIVLARDAFDDRAENYEAVIAVAKSRTGFKLERFLGDLPQQRAGRCCGPSRPLRPERCIAQAGGVGKQLIDGDLVRDLGRKAWYVFANRVLERQLAVLDKLSDGYRGEHLAE